MTPSPSIPGSAPGMYKYSCVYCIDFVGIGTGICVTGRIESGHVQVGETLVLLPANENINVKGKLYIFSEYQTYNFYSNNCI